MEESKIIRLGTGLTAGDQTAAPRTLVVRYGMNVITACQDNQIRLSKRAFEICFRGLVAVRQVSLIYKLAHLIDRVKSQLWGQNLTTAYRKAQAQNFEAAGAYELLALAVLDDPEQDYRTQPVVALNAVAPGCLPARCEAVDLRATEYLCLYADAAGALTLDFRMVALFPDGTRYLLVRPLPPGIVV